MTPDRVTANHCTCGHPIGRPDRWCDYCRANAVQDQTWVAVLAALPTVPLLGCLLGHVEHSCDLFPRSSVCPGARNSVGQRRVGGFANHAEQLNQIKRGLVERFADDVSVVGDHGALVEEGFVSACHASRIVDAQGMSRVVDGRPSPEGCGHPNHDSPDHDCAPFTSGVDS